MGTILLGGAGSNPNIPQRNNSIPIPTGLPNDPVVLLEDIKFAPLTNITGIPSGGSTGQVLKKSSNNDFDVDWKDDLIGNGGSSVPENTIINRDINGLITSVEKVSKTTVIIRNLDDSIASTNDGIYLKEIVRVDGMISEVNITVL